ncbi:hypothetical protein PQ455_05005 [Sphingomonas naphthae]|uniref:Class I SAM-dependent methyltransferase n=1 Tax=Sphingomonas naphthae TaxID=1813468 RepID=A0ABY7TPG0_9SPHN|nr:hypothetical protein [Sphingomonas naphthae]WCT74591.1 hypothetical protein PQ455_05005 [Sphingomonas naphthae]
MNPPPRSSRFAMGDFFDDYVRRIFPERAQAQGGDWQWPGDEWADDRLREATFDCLGAAFLAADSHVIEIGPGSGKYTQMLLDRTPASITAYEISPAFIGSLEARCADHVAAGRLAVRHSAWTDNRSLIDDFTKGGTGCNLFFGIDVFLMMDFQSALTYLISAACLLQKGGRFVGTFGDGGSDSGWARMLRDCGRHSAFDTAPSTRFHWIDEPILRGALERLGFGSIEIVHGPDGGLDIARLYVSATLDRPMPIEAALQILTPAGDSTNRPAPTA